MLPTVTHTELVATARREIRALKNPGIRSDAWRSVTSLLTAIAGYLPECFPSERTLAKKLGRHQQNVHRTLDRARELGLVVTTVRPLDKSYRDGQSYHLMCLSEPLRAAISRHRFQTSLDVRRKISFSEGDQHEPTSFGGGISGAGCASQTEPNQGGAVSDSMSPREWAKQDARDKANVNFGKQDELPGPTVISTDPATYLWRRFVRKWAAMQRQHREHSITRAGSSGPAIGYLRNEMLAEHGLSPEHIEAYFDEFIEEVAAGEVSVAEGQFAFQRFIPWWGRTDVEDPAEYQAKATHASDAIARAREIWAEQDQQKG